mgnify:CR=1 FL=1|jgi:ADP-heptose:LPS heptosyltransferase
MQKKILIYNSGGGLGDSIQLFPLILSLQNHFKGYEFFYLSAHDDHYSGKLNEFGIKIRTLNLGLQYFGFRWWHYFVVRKKLKSQSLDKFDLIIDLQSKIRNTLILNHIPRKVFYSSTFNYFFCSKKNNYSSDKNLINKTLNNLKIMIGEDIKKIDYDIKNLPERLINESRRLLPDKNYIGFSITQGNVYRKKAWPIEKFIELANKIKDKNKIPVFFVEENETLLINKIKAEVNNSLFPEHNTKISCPALVTALASRLDMAISIDNGIMHMISLAKTPMTVLFGPTNSEKFAPNYVGVKVIDSKAIYNLEDISRISVEDVYRSI